MSKTIIKTSRIGALILLCILTFFLPGCSEDDSTDPESESWDTEGKTEGSLLAGESRFIDVNFVPSRFYRLALISTSGDVDLFVYKVNSSGEKYLVGSSEQNLVNSTLDAYSFVTFSDDEDFSLEVIARLDSTYDFTFSSNEIAGPEMPSRAEYDAYEYNIDGIIDFAKARGCLACHSAQKRIVGPAWKLVSLRMKNEPGIISRLTEKVRMGGRGYWGNVPMPAYSPRVSDEDIQIIVNAIIEGSAAVP